MLAGAASGLTLRDERDEFAFLYSIKVRRKIEAKRDGREPGKRQKERKRKVMEKWCKARRNVPEEESRVNYKKGKS